MRACRFVLCFSLVGICAVMSGPVMAADEALVTFVYSELDGDFMVDSGDGSPLFTASDDFDTAGEVTRLIDPRGVDAVFAANNGFNGLASYEMVMPIAYIDTETFISLGGTLTLTDADGDSFTGQINGLWFRVGQSASFSGLLSGVTANSQGNGNFEGTDGSGFSMAFPVAGPFDGNLVSLAVGEWFLDDAGAPHDFENIDTLVAGAIVPEPMTLSLLALGGLAMVARRKRTLG